MLIHLSMPYSNLKRLWNKAPAFKDLKIIDLSYSLELETTPDFGNSKSVKDLDFRGCERLLEVHPSIRDLNDLYRLDIRGCTQLKELGEPIGQLNELAHLYLYSWVKRSPEPMKQWPSMSYLYLGHCSNLRRLPKQLGDMKGLKFLDASFTAIEQLPDSITHLKGLVELRLSNCNKLSKLPEYIGNMKCLQKFIACNTAIEHLPDSFVSLINLFLLDLAECKNLRNLPNSIWKLKLLKILDLNFCSKLERLPDELGNMQYLEVLGASHTAIEVVPDSIQQLSRLQVLDLDKCDKLRYLPNSIWNLTSLAKLYIPGIGIDNLPHTVKNTKLITLTLSCDIRLWLPIILSFSSLERLVLHAKGESLSSAEPFRLSVPFSLSELHNLQFLEFISGTRFGSLLPELPLNLKELRLCNHATLKHLPDLSDLKQLKNLDILGYYSLESLPPLPPHLQSLVVYDCRSLQVPSDMSMSKELVELTVGRCNLESVSLKENYLQVGEWFRGVSKLCFDIPPDLGDNFLGLALWVRFTSKNESCFSIRFVLTNKTNGIEQCYRIKAYSNTDDVHSVARCISRDLISIRSGDGIEISFERQPYSFVEKREHPVYEQVKVEMCAAHVIQKTPLALNFPSFFNNLINGA